jgi:ribonuclease Z
MKFFYQVVTTPTADTPGTVVLLNFPDKRYFFGQISEGTQRACTERGVKLTYLSDIFITGRTEWANLGGLIGVILTLADATASSAAAVEEQHRRMAERRLAAARQGKSQKEPQAGHHPGTGQDRVDVTVHGATNLSHTMATARRFVFRKGMPIYMHEYDSQSIGKQIPTDKEDPFEVPTWSDSNIKVWALPIKPDSSSSPKQFCQPRAQSPRKRSLGEFQETIDQDQLDHDQRAKDQLVRQSVVSDMFNSSWKMDALVETPLAQVKMPAAMFVRNPETKDIEPYKGPAPGDDGPLPDIKVLVRQPWPGATVDKLPPTAPSKEAVSYIIRNQDVRGKFDPVKVRALKVPEGPAWAALTRGESVQSQDGQTVTPDMVLGPARIGKGIAILDLPSSDYVEDLLNRPEWKSPAVMTELKAFVWILGSGVGDHPKLREFVASMPHCKHTVSSADYCPNYLALTSAAEAAIRLARLKGDSYSIPVHDNVTLPQVGLSTDGPGPKSISLDNLPFEPLKPGFIVDMEPNFKINKEEILEPLNTARTLQRIPRSVEQRMGVIRTRIRKPAFQKQLAQVRQGLPGAEAEIIALGTGSSAPSKYRNVSATLVHAPGYGYYLLDCGENTLGQLQRVFEPEKLREVLRNLRMIWISHLHADHHLGTASVIKAWYRENYGAEYKPSPEPETDMKNMLQENRLFVVSEEMMIAWLEEYAAVEDYGFDKIVPLVAHPVPDGPSIKTTFTYRHPRSGAAPYGRDTPDRTVLDFNDDSSPLALLLKSATGLDDILTTRVRHCKGALALSIVFPDGFKISYSGDCRPSDKFASIGHGSTVLIHEATFQDDMVGSALAKRHSTSAEALEVGRRMGARAVLLTHFSQRYQKIAYLDQHAGTHQHDEIISTRQAKAAAAREAGDADIPLDDPEEQPAEPASGALLLDDIRFPAPGRPGLPRSNIYIPGKTAPIATAMDYMRIKVGDLAYAQAYAPAVEKLVDLMERNAAQQAEAAKKKHQEEEEARKAKKNKKFAKAQVAAAVAVAATVAAEPEQPHKSVFSASESESGWETSDYEE